ncbi:MAG: Rpn family recombination-promoting nuclease/putative transposase [Planctomycetota bacterium]
MPLGISPLVDFAFKLMLASRGHERVTISFLNAILGESMRITRIEIQNPIVGPNFDGDKWLVLDVLAEDERGRRFNIEMQTSIPAGLRQRLAFYDARLYVEQMREGDRYHELLPAIVICVLDKLLLKETSTLHTDFRLRDDKGQILTDDLQVHLLELTKLAVTRENLSQATPAEQWAYFLLNADKLTLDEIRNLFPEPEFEEAAGV